VHQGTLPYRHSSMANRANRFQRADSFLGVLDAPSQLNIEWLNRYQTTMTLSRPCFRPAGRCSDSRNLASVRCYPRRSLSCR
jgi:hypothetical protein